MTEAQKTEALRNALQRAVRVLDLLTEFEAAEIDLARGIARRESRLLREALREVEG